MNSRALLAALAAAILYCGSVHAQIFRAYLSIDGSDANPCTVTLPCRLLPAAIAAVANGGEVWMLDSANYNVSPVNVTKSVTILAIPGAVGSVVALGGPALQLGTAGTRVSLRNLDILPFPGNEAQDGIVILDSDVRLIVQGCNVRRFLAGTGLYVVEGADVSIIDSTMSENNVGANFEGGSKGYVSGSHFDHNVSFGVVVAGTAFSTRVSIARSTMSGNSTGIWIRDLGTGSHADVSVTDSVIAGNNTYGAYALVIFASSSARLAISRSQVMGNTDRGVYASGVGVKVMAGGNTVAFNGTGFANDSGGLFETSGTNELRNNTNVNLGTITNVGGI